MSVDTKSAPGTRVVVLRRGRLVRAELRKIFTTNSWWIFGLFILFGTAFSLLINIFQANGELAAAEQERLHPPDFSQIPLDQRPRPSEQQAILDDFARHTDVARILARSAANVYTSDSC